ncbi:hypothetical protein [Streptomyces anulatus]|uniref:hypothetical protein n=1 Tax=Streptomyces anulatus TaxID=1892 RepID=UPI00070CC0C1|nr:hypothetical protein [Streptomyces anulatus]
MEQAALVDPPRWPRLTGALLGLGGGVLAAGVGVLAAVPRDLPGYYALGYVLLVSALAVGLMKLGLPSEKRALALWLPGALLIFGTPYGVKSAVLDWRGEQVPVTVTEVERGPGSYHSGETYHCKVEAGGESFWVKGSDQCDQYSRPGDRFEVLRDPEGLVSVSDPDPLIGFSFLVPCVGGALLVMTVAGYRGLKRPS